MADGDEASALPAAGPETGVGAAGQGGYRVPSPDPADRITWPGDFGTRFTVFVDTEEEFDWRGPLSRDARETRAMAGLPALHRRFADRAVPITYLIDHPIAASPDAVAVLNDLLADGRSSIGAQLHPWVTPPHEETVNRFNSFAGNLPLALERAKIEEISGAIDRAFGFRPILFRAGRYGIGPNTLGLLAEAGYRIDSSMRAAYDYSDEGGPDFGAIGNHAFRAGPQGALVELPLTTVFTGGARRGGIGLYRALTRVPKGRGIAARLGMLSRVSLTPEDMPLNEAREAVRVAVGEGVRVLNFAFHSPSAVPGHTPYVRDAADLAAFHRWWDAILDLLDRLSVRPASPRQLLAACDDEAACGRPLSSAIAGGAGGL